MDLLVSTEPGARHGPRFGGADFELHGDGASGGGAGEFDHQRMPDGGERGIGGDQAAWGNSSAATGTVGVWPDQF